MTTSTRDCLAWNALSQTRGLGPKRLAPLILSLHEQRRGAGDLLGESPERLATLGLSPVIAERAAEALRFPPSLPDPPPGIHFICPDSDEYPRDRVTRSLSLPASLYCLGNLALLRRGGLAVSGSRHAHPDAIDFAAEVARLVAREGIHVIGGNAAGVDEAAHVAALSSGGTTTMALAEGLERFSPRPGVRATDPEAWLAVSEFDLPSAWSVQKAMQRNATIAALADAVLVVAADTKGGAWEQGRLCLRTGKRLMVPDYPAGVAPGNKVLIEEGAIPVSTRDPAGLIQLIQDDAMVQQRFGWD
jgi:predicted Rossmann fold nucleotide-binding protein DprA/Smf involved in DNA uptake